MVKIVGAEITEFIDYIIAQSPDSDLNFATDEINKFTDKTLEPKKVLFIRTGQKKTTGWMWKAVVKAALANKWLPVTLEEAERVITLFFEGDEKKALDAKSLASEFGLFLDDDGINNLLGALSEILITD